MEKSRIEKDFMVMGYRCVILAQYMGHRCGYIGIPKGNKFYNNHYDSIDIDVHGGLTFSSGGDGEIKYPVKSVDTWWIGFDCAHYRDAKDFDLMKSFGDSEMVKHTIELERRYPTGGTVRTTEYVEQELIRAVEQLIEKA